MSEGGLTRLSQFGALRSRPYRRWFVGGLASVGGTQLLVIGQGWLVFELSGSTLYLGYLGFAAALPAIVMSLFGGVLADRLDKRRLLMGTSLSTAVLLFVLGVLDVTELVAVWHVLLLSGLISLVMGLDWPARQAFFPSLIEREHMMSAVALNSILWQGTRMILPAIGGLVIAWSDTYAIFLAAGAGFTYMFFVLATLPRARSEPATGSSLQQFVDGVRFIADNRLFAVLIPLTWGAMFFGNSFLQVMPAFADLLGTGEKGFGFLVSAFGIGSMFGTFLVGAYQQSPRLGHIILGGIGGTAAGTYGFAAVTGLRALVPGAPVLALGCVFVAGFFTSVFLITSMTALQLNVPDRLRGRVMGIHGITFLLVPLGGIFVGALANWTSAPLAVAAGATVVVLATLWVAATQPAVRDLGAATESGKGD